MIEEWRNVIGYEGRYKISNLGRVYSISRLVEHNGSLKRRGGKFLKKTPNNQGYLSVSLYTEGKSVTTKVHRLVALHFIPNPLGKKEVNHVSFDKANNSIFNLEWCTPKENSVHAIGRSASHRLNEEKVREIRSSNLTIKELYIKYGVSRMTISRILKRESWRYVL